MPVTYIVNGVEVDPNGQPVNKDEQPPHSWIPVVHNADFDLSQGEISDAARLTAPDPSDFDTDEEYRVAVQENEAQVADSLRRSRMNDAGLDPETGQPRQLTLPGTDEPADDDSEEQARKNQNPPKEPPATDPPATSGSQAGQPPAKDAPVTPAPTTPANATAPASTAAEKAKDKDKDK